MLTYKKKIQSITCLIVVLAVLAAAGVASASDLMPSGRILLPNLSPDAAKLMPPSFTVRFEGTDPDAPDQLPARFRYIFKAAVTPDGSVIRSPYEYELYHAEVLSLEDPLWTDWMDVSGNPDDLAVTFNDLPANEYFLFSVQFLDQDGAASDPWGYQVSTLHIRVLANFFRPEVTVAEVFLGQTTSGEWSSEIAGGQPLSFSWIASADAYGGQIVSYRHGWDLTNSDDPNDPGWAVPPGLLPENLYAAKRSFQDGVHVFTVRVEDDANQVRVINWTLRVVPFVSPEFQLPLLVLDQVADANVQNWPSQSGEPLNDESYRNAWWQFLADGVGGVAGLNWDRDWKNHTDQVSYSDLVQYKSVLCYAQFNDINQILFQQFRAVNDVDKYVWLAPYQQQGGNFFLAGGGSMESFFENKPNYMIPMIFDTQETTLVVNGVTYEVGFGTTEMPDGSIVQRGPRMYPYATAGISALDWTSPNTKTIYNRSVAARFDRVVDCVGLKGLVLDPAFKANHLVGPGAIADTIWTDAAIDWPDHVAAAADTLGLLTSTFPFRNDEFINANISSRSTVITEQGCADGPGGMCIEPMFEGVARFDYVRQYNRDRGDANWPQSEFADWELDSECGPLALTSYEGVDRSSARTNGKTFGYMSYKNVADKPSGKADVYWGFDPYRFDHAEAQKAVTWVLDYFGLQINN